MSFFREQPLPESFPPFVAARSSFGFVPGIFRAQSLLPDHIEAQARVVDRVLLQEHALPRRLKESVLLAIAAAENNEYCVAAHSRFLGALGVEPEEIEAIVQGAPDVLGEPLHALISYALEVASRRTLVGAGDLASVRAAGWTDDQILEAVLTAALIRFLCTMSVGLGVEPDFEPPSFPEPPAGGYVKVGRAQRAAGPPPASTLLAPSLAEDFGPFAFFRDRFGFLPNIFRAQTLRPDVIDAEARIVERVLLSEDVLTRQQKEYVLLVVSAANLNTYCVAVHCEMLRRLGVPAEESDRVATDHRHAGLSTADGALLDFAHKLNQRPREFCEADVRGLRGAGFTEQQVLEAVIMTGLTAFLNTVQVALAPPTDFFPRIDFESMSPAGVEEHQIERTGVDPDTALISRLRGGDHEAFNDLMQRHAGRVYRTLISILGNAADAEDETQETFLRAYERIDEFRGRAKFSTWLTRIAINQGLQRLRRTRRSVLLDEDDPGDQHSYEPRHLAAWVEDPERLYSRTQTREIVESALLGLPPKYRVVVVLRDIEQLSGEETASVLGLGLAAMKSRLSRGRLLLRDELAARYAVPGGMARIQ